MANGIKTPGTWVPGTKSGVVVESKYVKGGYITVDSVEERDRLLATSEVITPGTKVFVREDNTEYIYSEPVLGQGEFQDTITNTINRVSAEGFVKETQVETIVQREAQSMVESAVEEVVPGIVNSQIDIKLEDVKIEIAEEATAAAKEEAVKQVEQQIERDYVKDEKLTTTVEPIQNDVSDLKQKSQEADERIDQNKRDITGVAGQVTDINSNLSENYYDKNYITDNYSTKNDTSNQIDAKLRGYTSTENLNQQLELKADKTDLDSLASKEELSNQIQEVRDAIATNLAYGEF